MDGCGIKTSKTNKTKHTRRVTCDKNSNKCKYVVHSAGTNRILNALDDDPEKICHAGEINRTTTRRNTPGGEERGQRTDPPLLTHLERYRGREINQSKPA